MTEPVGIVRLVTDANGSSHFVEGELAMSARGFAPPAAPLEVSDAMTATAVIYWRAPVGWDGQQHPAPALQCAFVLRGAIEVQAGDGTSLRLGPGDGLLLEDVTGAGHKTRVVSDKPALGMFVQVPQ